MNDKKKVICTTNLVEELTKDKVYKVEYIHYGQTVYYDIIDDYGVISTYHTDRFIPLK